MSPEIATVPSASGSAAPPLQAWTLGHSVAQTNVQLFNQLREQEFGDGVLQAKRACDLAAQLFVTNMRASGKTTLAHHVGVASILAHVHAPPDVVAAGLLHAAYPLGDFGTGTGGATAAKRREVARAAGEAAETLVYEFSRLRWNQKKIHALAADWNSLDATLRTVLLIRLANEAENHLDLNMAYCSQFRWRHRFIAHSGPVLVLMAARLGVPQLGAELERVFEETLQADVPDELRRADRLGYDLRPRSYRRRFRARARRAVQFVLERLGRAAPPASD